MPVDEEKLQAALQQAGGGSGSSADGTIEFKPGKAVAVYGKGGKAIDAGRSVNAVKQAYRTLVETNATAPVTVPTTTKRSTVSNAEVDREMKAFAEPAMSAIVTVQTDAAHSVRLSRRTRCGSSCGSSRRPTASWSTPRTWTRSSGSTARPSTVC